MLYIVAKGGALTNVKCRISALIPERGDPAPVAAMTCSAPSQIDPGKIEQITLTLSADQQLKRGNYTATLQVLGLDPTSTSVSQTTNFKLVVPAVSIKLSDADALRIRLIRRWPFSAASEAIPVAVRVTSDLLPTLVPSVLQSEIYVPDGASKDVFPGGYLKAEFCTAALSASNTPKEKQPAKHFWSRPGPPEGCVNGGSVLVPGQQVTSPGLTMQLEPSVPSSIKEATGTLHVQSTEFPTDLDVPVTLLVKDWWGYAAFVVFLGQLLSFWVTNWINVGRRQKLNKLTLWPLENRLVNLLLTRPDLNDSPDVAAVSSLLDSAAQSNKLSDVDAAMNFIKNAQDKLAELYASPIPPTSDKPKPPQLFLLQKDHAYAFRRIHFVVLNPDDKWPATAVYKWEWSGQDGMWKTLFEAQNLRDIVTHFDAPGNYSVRLSVDKTQLTPYGIRLERDKTTGIQWKIAQADKAILLLAVVFAAILSYLAIDQLQTFGTVSDYALGFLGGFGLNSTTSGFSAVLSRFGASPQGGSSARS